MCCGERSALCPCRCPPAWLASTRGHATESEPPDATGLDPPAAVMPTASLPAIPAVAASSGTTALTHPIQKAGVKARYLATHRPLALRARTGKGLGARTPVIRRCLVTNVRAAAVPVTEQEEVRARASVMHHPLTATAAAPHVEALRRFRLLE